MQRMNLAAYTPAGTAPAFVSINAEEDGTVSIAVRSKGTDGITGPQGCIYLTQLEAAAILAEAQLKLARMALDEPKAKEHK